MCIRDRVGRAPAADDLGTANEHARIDSERPADQAEHNDSSNAEAAAAHRDTNTAAGAATAAAVILHIVAAAEVIPTHVPVLPNMAAGSLPKPPAAFNSRSFADPWRSGLATDRLTLWVTEPVCARVNGS